MNNQNTPLVTVAMVTYNSAKYVRIAIESVLTSSYTNFELIISDDCSKDETWAIINKWSDKRIKAFRNEKNIGEYQNRNRCLHLASGKYIIYVDGDDKINRHALSTFVNTFEENPDCAFLISRPEDNRFHYPQKLLPKQIYKLHYLSDKTVINLSLLRTCFNKERLQNAGGFSSKYKAGDDYIRLKLTQEYPIVLIEDGLVWWRRSPGQASERLKNSYNGFVEPLIIKHHFLAIKSCPLSADEIIHAKKILKKKAFHTWKAIIKEGKILWAIKFLIDVNRLKK